MENQFKKIEAKVRKDIAELGWIAAYNKYYTEYRIDFKTCSKPIQPKLPTKATIDDVKEFNAKFNEYTKELEAWELGKNDRKSLEKQVSRFNNMLYTIIEDAMKDSAGLNDIPEQYRDKVYNYAYAQGHSSGLGEIHCYLTDLVEIFDTNNL